MTSKDPIPSVRWTQWRALKMRPMLAGELHVGSCFFLLHSPSQKSGHAHSGAEWAKTIREPPDTKSASEGAKGEEGHGKVDIVGRLRQFYNTNQLQMQTRGRGSKYPKILRMSSLEAPLDQVSYEQVCSDNKSRVSFKPPRRNFLTRLSQPESPPPASGSNCPPWCGTCWTIRPKTGSTFIGLGQT